MVSFTGMADADTTPADQRSGRSRRPPAASPPKPDDQGNSTPKATGTKPDIITDFLARKQAVLQTLLARFPVLPRMIALFAAYCAVACICMASLVFLFVVSFVLTGHDRVVARLRWLLELARANRDAGLTGRGLAMMWWAMRLAGDLFNAAANAAGSASAAAGNGPQSSSTPHTQGRENRRRSATSSPPFSNSSRHHQQQQSTSSPSSANRRERARAGYTSHTTGSTREYRAQTC